jgi:hypothetical protein
MSEKKVLPFLVVAAAPTPADEPSAATRYIFEREYASMRRMPAVVLAAAISQHICAAPRTPSDITQILADAIEAMRAEYRAEGDISEKICKDCDAITTWRVEVLAHVGTPGDLIERCTVCGKVSV